MSPAIVEKPEVDLVLDTSGKFCPVPVMEIARAIKAMKSGQVIELVATDPGVATDMPSWCKATRHELLGLVREGATLRAYIRKP